MAMGRASHTATLLLNNKVLIAGGDAGVYDAGVYAQTSCSTGFSTASAELYDPLDGTIVATGSMSVPTEGHTATLLVNGTVLIAGGLNVGKDLLASAELYDPVSGSFTAVGSMSVTREGHTATLLSNGTVLIAGGSTVTDHIGSVLASAETYP
jgi:hypothetical protein